MMTAGPSRAIGTASTNSARPCPIHATARSRNARGASRHATPAAPQTSASIASPATIAARWPCVHGSVQPSTASVSIAVTLVLNPPNAPTRCGHVAGARRAASAASIWKIARYASVNPIVGGVRIVDASASRTQTQNDVVASDRPRSAHQRSPLPKCASTSASA